MLGNSPKRMRWYPLFYQISGLQKFDSDIKAIGTDGSNNLNEVADTVGNLYSSLGTALNTTDQEATNLLNSMSDGSINSLELDTAINKVEASGKDIQVKYENMKT